MSNVHFAKFNINEKIYKVYNEKNSLKELLLKVYEGLNTDIELQESSYGKTTNFKFIHLFKETEKMIINGRIVAYAPGTHISYDDKNDDIIETEDSKKATYITFSFDINKETIGFVPKFDFGRNQFINRFEMLVEVMCPDIGEVSLILETDRQALDAKLSKFEHVQELSLQLIPPNNDKKLFNELFDLDPDKLEETGGTNFFFRFKGTAKRGLNLSAEYVKNLILGVSIGYGKLTAKGKNTSGEDLNVKSNTDALYTRPIFDNNKDNVLEIEEKTRAGISELSYHKNKLKQEHFDMKKEKEELLRRMKLNEDEEGEK